MSSDLSVSMLSHSFGRHPLRSQEEVSTRKQAYYKVRSPADVSHRRLTRGCARLNSTLSARIEELNAQISTLYVENLRLRASEIALCSQLKKEKEKSRKILSDTETAVRPYILARWSQRLTSSRHTLS